MDRNEINGIIIMPENGEFSDRNDKSKYHEIPGWYTEKYILYTQSMEVIGFMGVRKNDIIENYIINIYEDMVYRPEVQIIGKYLDEKIVKDFNPDKTLIFYIGTLYDSMAAPSDNEEPIKIYDSHRHLFLIEKRLNDNNVLTIDALTSKNGTRYVDSFSSYFKEELLLPILIS